MRQEKLNGLKELLANTGNIVIVTHWSPDGDAIGSSLGLYNYLIQKKQKVTVITPNDYPLFLSWMPGNDNIVDFSLKPEIAKDAVKKANLIFCLDFNTLTRIDALGVEVANSSAQKCLIDHHLQPEDFADYMLHDVKTSSTCELIYDFMECVGDLHLLNKNVANCLYAGIMTDTGSFRFPSTSPKTHRVVANLIEAGADHAEIHNLIYDNNSFDKLRLLGFSLANKLVILKEFGTAYFALSNEELNRFNYKKGDTEGLVNYALSVEGVHMAAFIVERDGKIKLSFRSKGDVDVNTFARNHFNGGGHKNAAGGISDLSLDETVKKFVSLLK